jgi:hypothetical protein
MNNGMKQQLELVRNEEGREVHKGFTLGGWQVAEKLISENWVLQTGWSDGLLRKVWINYDLNGILTYCEGDIILEAFKSKQHFNEAIERANKFYAMY